eukprot:jgi/Ulvmu1/11126/UM071_0009.1
MVLYVVGLGLYDHQDVTLRGLDAIRKCKRVFLEAYTSILLVGTSELEELYGKEVEVADREMVESQSGRILQDARTEDVAFCVVGDPFGATTHSDLVLRAHQEGIKVSVIHNASIMNAIAACGLQLYRFGQTISVVFFTDTWRPESFYDKLVANKSLGLHTLCLLDIKVKEPTMESLARGKPVYEPPRYMTVKTCIEQLLEIEEKREEGAATGSTMGVGVARMGADDQVMRAGTLEELLTVDFGRPLHSFVVCGDLEPFEEEMLQLIR